MSESRNLTGTLLVAVAGIVMGLFGLYQITTLESGNNSSPLLPTLFFIGGSGMFLTSVFRLYKRTNSLTA